MSADYKALYQDAMAASNEAGMAGFTAADTIRQLAAERDELQRDASRYRWLRKGNDYQHEAPMVLQYEKDSDTGERPYWSLADAAMDAAIDAARQALEKP